MKSQELPSLQQGPIKPKQTDTSSSWADKARNGGCVLEQKKETKRIAEIKAAREATAATESAEKELSKNFDMMKRALQNKNTKFLVRDYDVDNSVRVIFGYEKACFNKTFDYIWSLNDAISLDKLNLLAEKYLIELGLDGQNLCEANKMFTQGVLHIKTLRDFVKFTTVKLSTKMVDVNLRALTLHKFLVNFKRVGLERPQDLSEALDDVVEVGTKGFKGYRFRKPLIQRVVDLF